MQRFLDFDNTSGACVEIMTTEQAAIAAGMNKYAEKAGLFARNDAVGSSWEVVGPQSAAYTWLGEAEQLQVSSTDDTSDTDGGTGANTVTIDGLDGNLEPLRETVTLNGTTAVTTSNSFRRVNNCWVETSGNDCENAGDISINDNADTNTLDQIPTGLGVGTTAVVTTAKNQLLYLRSMHATEDSSAGARLRIRHRPLAGNVTWHTSFMTSSNQGPMANVLTGVIIFPEQCDVQVEAISSAGGADVIASMEGWTEDIAR